MFSQFTAISSPLDQFEIRNLLSFDAPIMGNVSFSITNIGLDLTVGMLIAFTLYTLATNFNNKIVSNNLSISQESSYAFLISSLLYAIVAAYLIVRLIFDFNLDSDFFLLALPIEK